MENKTLKQYIGTKMVKAEPMAKSAAVAKGWARPSEGNEDVPGYHVQYTNPDGSTYDSWSPKDVFEKSYQVAEDFKDRLIIELKELKERFNKLEAIMNKNDYDKIVEKCGPVQTALMIYQYHAMRHYYDILRTRIELLEDFPDKKYMPNKMDLDFVCVEDVDKALEFVGREKWDSLYIKCTSEEEYSNGQNTERNQ